MKTKEKGKKKGGEGKERRWIPKGNEGEEERGRDEGKLDEGELA